MRPIPVIPGILEQQHTPTLDSIPYSNILAHEPFQVALSTTADPHDSSLLFPGRLKRVPSDPNVSALEIGSRLSFCGYYHQSVGLVVAPGEGPWGTG